MTLMNVPVIIEFEEWPLEMVQEQLIIFKLATLNYDNGEHF